MPALLFDANQGHAGIHLMGSAGKLFQHGFCTCFPGGFSQLFPIDGHHGIGPDDQNGILGKALRFHQFCHGSRFSFGELLHHSVRGLHLDVFICFTYNHFKSKPSPGHKLPSSRRRRSKHNLFHIKSPFSLFSYYRNPPAGFILS